MSEWIECGNTGKPKVLKGTLVQVRMRSGAVSGASYPVEDWRWSHLNTASDIVAYRVGAPSDESAERKGRPIVTGCIDYFPDALLAVAELSRYGNDKHNQGEPLHWSRDKSSDHADCCVRHLIERGKMDYSYGPEKPVRHSTAAAWRALANLQIEIEESRK